MESHLSYPSLPPAIAAPGFVGGDTIRTPQPTKDPRIKSGGNAGDCGAITYLKTIVRQVQPEPWHQVLPVPLRPLVLQGPWCRLARLGSPVLRLVQSRLAAGFPAVRRLAWHCRCWARNRQE